MLIWWEFVRFQKKLGDGSERHGFSNGASDIKNR